MADTTRAHQSLSDRVEDVLRRAFESVEGPRSRVLWWDAGGHLQHTIQRASSELGVERVERDHPLQFRAWVADQGETHASEPDRVVWYVPEASQDRDWFRDVDAMGEVIERSIEDVVANLYDIQPWQLRPWTAEGAVSDTVAGILSDKLSGGRRPTLSELQTSILTDGDSQPVEYVLRGGWGDLPRSTDVVGKLRDLLADEGVPRLQAEDGPSEIVEKVREWAVAGWLNHEEIDREAFPDPIADSKLDYAFRRLRAVLGDDPQTNVLPTYQNQYWPEVVASHDEPWALAECPVEGALEDRLWETWLTDLEEGREKDCAERARTRMMALRRHTRREDEEVGKTSPSWIRAWRQAAALADLQHRYKTWNDRDVPVHSLYADREKGSWHIDAAVRHIIVSGKPEEALPTGHPVQDALADLREQLVSDEYLAYLQELGDQMKQALGRGEILEDELKSSVDFWTDHEDTLSTSNEAIVFYLDALRLDLARELTTRLQERSDRSSELDLNVEESVRLGTLPSETKFGMAAVLPGRARAFEVRLDNGSLEAYRNGQKLSTTQRHELLRREGWSVAPDDQNPWENARVAYVDTELDDIGETDLEGIEKKLAERIDDLAELIFDKIRQGGWNRAHVVTDHGFVLLPEDTGIESLSPPDGEVKRRRVADENLPDDGQGVLLSRDRLPDAPYLASPVQLLVDPQRRFKKQGLSDARYYHGGALPQECILSFLSIETA